MKTKPLQNRTIALSVLFSVFALGLLGAQQSYAIVLEDQDSCEIGLGVAATWDGVSECNVEEEFNIESGDSLTINSGITLSTGDIININTDGVVTNMGTIRSDDGEIALYGTINNYGTIQLNAGSFDMQGILNNEVGGEITNTGLTLTVSGELNNFGTLNNKGGVNVSDNSSITNDGLIETFDDHEFAVAGTFTNRGTFIMNDGIFSIQNTGFAETFDTINIYSPAKVTITGQLDILESSEFLNESEIDLGQTGIIRIIGILYNDGLFVNSCGLVNVISPGMIVGPDPTDDCPIQSITIDSPPNGSFHGNFANVIFTGTAIDIDGYGVEKDISSGIEWSDNVDILSDNLGSTVSNQLPTTGVHQITAYIKDSGDNEKSAIINIEIFNDADSDGYLSILNGG
ncbi:hypothetical protein BG20_I2310, partial [Candidatus Nitrosarchaeum limnium BG20]